MNSNLFHRPPTPRPSNWRKAVSIISITAIGMLAVTLGDMRDIPKSRGQGIALGGYMKGVRGPGERALVAGAASFLGEHIVDQLLLKGYKVVGTVRKESNPRSTSFKKRFSRELASGQLTLKSVDLTDSIAVSRIFGDEGFESVFCVASPFLLKEDVTDHEAQIVQPMIELTETLIKGCIEHKIPNVIYTSSTAAVRGPGDLPRNGVYFTSEDWNSKSQRNEPAQAYQWAKTRAERLARVACEENGISFSSMLPSFLLGPVARLDIVKQPIPSPTSPSLRVFQDWVRGEKKCESRLICDVRDCARAHILAAEKLGDNPEIRRIIVGHQTRTSGSSIASWIREALPDSRASFDASWVSPIAMGQIEMETLDGLHRIGIEELTEPYQTVIDTCRSLGSLE
ncbi:hypothetical protein AAMO2058_000950200 [Amorphochlora amoebiformis]